MQEVFKEHCIVIALGIDTAGRKHVLGLREGATETAAVSTALLNDLVTRGLPTERAMLFLVDRSAALRRAISDVYGSLGVVHRYQVPQVSERAGPSAGAAARQRRPGAAYGVGPAFGSDRETGSGAFGRLAGGRALRRRGIHPRGAGRDADGAAFGPDGTAAAGRCARRTSSRTSTAGWSATRAT